MYILFLYFNFNRNPKIRINKLKKDCFIFIKLTQRSLKANLIPNHRYQKNGIQSSQENQRILIKFYIHQLISLITSLKIQLKLKRTRILVDFSKPKALIENLIRIKAYLLFQKKKENFLLRSLKISSKSKKSL